MDQNQKFRSTWQTTETNRPKWHFLKLLFYLNFLLRVLVLWLALPLVSAAAYGSWVFRLPLVVATRESSHYSVCGHVSTLIWTCTFLDTYIIDQKLTGLNMVNGDSTVLSACRHLLRMEWPYAEPGVFPGSLKSLDTMSSLLPSKCGSYLDRSMGNPGFYFLLLRPLSTFFQMLIIGLRKFRGTTSWYTYII